MPLLAAVRNAVEKACFEEAAALLAPLLEHDTSSEALHLSGLVNAGLGRLEHATWWLERAVRACPGKADWHRDLGAVHLSLELWSEAKAAFEKAIELEPGGARGWRGLALALIGRGEVRDAFAALQQSLEIDPRSKSAHKSMAAIFRHNGLYSQARRHEAEVVRLEPADLDAKARLALDCWKSDELPAALRQSQAVVDHYAASAEFHGFNLYLRLFDAEETGETLRAAYAEWPTRHCPPGTEVPLTNVSDPERRLRFGYLSAEFAAGPPVYFLAPLIAGHDSRTVEVFLYSTSRRPDDHTQWFRDHCDHWRECGSLSDEDLIRTIHQDAIDILVEPSGYSHDHRLNVMSRRAAPIQIAYPNYPSTRGIPQIDYILTDRWATPEGSEAQYTETPIRLPSGVISYSPPSDAPAETDLPAKRNGFVTYGIFQRRVKLNTGVLDAVAEVLHATADSRLLIQHLDLALDQPSSDSRTSLVREFLSRDIPERRIRFAGKRLRSDAMLLMAECDIALDSFPFNGHTTTCECLWMGVPVVTLSGATHAARVSASILGSIGLSEFVAYTTQRYTEIARWASEDLTSLAELRRGMRNRLLEAGFVESRRLSREVEAATRELWKIWCIQNKTEIVT